MSTEQEQLDSLMKKVLDGEEPGQIELREITLAVATHGKRRTNFRIYGGSPFFVKTVGLASDPAFSCTARLIVADQEAASVEVGPEMQQFTQFTRADQAWVPLAEWKMPDHTIWVRSLSDFHLTFDVDPPRESVALLCGLYAPLRRTT